MSIGWKSKFKWNKSTLAILSSKSYSFYFFFLFWCVLFFPESINLYCIVRILMGSASYVREQGRIEERTLKLFIPYLVLNKWKSCEFEDSIYQRLMLLHKVTIVAAHKIVISSLRKCNYYLKLFNKDRTNYHRPLLQWCLLVIFLAT